MKNDKKITTKKDRYFGSDLNEFIYHNCDKKMVVNNIDLIMLKHRPNKKSILRVIESKHTREKPMPDGQKAILSVMKNVFIDAGMSNFAVDFQLYVVYGDQPYNELRIFDSINQTTFEIKGRQQVIDWLEMK
jgi:hypothetical protein